MIAIIFLLLIVIALAGAVTMFYFINKSQKKMREEKEEKEKDLFWNICPVKAVEELPVVDHAGNVARWGLIVLPDGEYRVMMAIRGVNFNLLNKEEQQGIARALQGMAFALDYSVQFYTSNQMIDFSRAAEELLEIAGNLDGPLGQYAFMLYQYFNDQSRMRRITSRQTYAVLRASDLDREAAERELYSLVQRFKSAIKPVGVRADVLSPEAAVDALHAIFNRDRLFKPSQAVAAGVLSPVKMSRQVLAES
ncbi:hypothetical protein SDD30_15365 [Moorella naiadis]|uniref:hypothetical protein n=1 Tax=Moorella naiadis (nom. illeg.) TaxID=3093670 RepID=UPI003D9CBA17